MGLGITVKELRNTKKGEINDITIATNIIGYSLTYTDEEIVDKISSKVFKEAFINYLKIKNNINL